MGGVPGAAIREARSSCSRQGLAPLFRALAEQSQGLGAENRALHLERDEANVQIRREVGLSQRESAGREACRTAARLNQADKTLGAVDCSGILSPAQSAGLAREAGRRLCGWLGPRVSEIFGLQWQDLDLENGAVSFWRGFV